MLRFTGFGCLKRKSSPKFQAQNGVKNGKFHANFALRGRGADKKPSPILSPGFGSSVYCPSAGAELRGVRIVGER